MCRHADAFDILLMVLGTIGAMAAGAELLWAVKQFWAILSMPSERQAHTARDRLKQYDSFANFQI